MRLTRRGPYARTALRRCSSLRSAASAVRARSRRPRASSTRSSPSSSAGMRPAAPGELPKTRQAPATSCERMRNLRKPPSGGFLLALDAPVRQNHKCYTMTISGKIHFTAFYFFITARTYSNISFYLSVHSIKSLFPHNFFYAFLAIQPSCPCILYKTHAQCLFQMSLSSHLLQLPCPFPSHRIIFNIYLVLIIWF